MNKDGQTAKKDYASYHVGLKVLIKKEDEFLFLINTDKLFDLPGGRIDNVEYALPISQIIDREIKEELGSGIKYKLGRPLFQYRRHFNNDRLDIFITVYEAKYLAGGIQLFSEFTDFVWINPKEFDFKLEHFFHKEEYLTFKKYFKTL